MSKVSMVSNVHMFNFSTGICERCGASREEQTAFACVWSQEASHDLPYVSKLLNELSVLFAERNAVYKDNFRMVGRIMEAMFPDGVPPLKGEDDFNRWHLFELAIVKLSRYAINYQAGGHEDSLNDMIVYLAMVAAIDNGLGYRAEKSVSDA